jgi:hypothetical protein
MSWRRGDAVVWRSRPNGDIATVIPMRVIEDRADRVVLFQAAGSVCKKRSGVRGAGPRGRQLVPGGWDGTHVDRVWPGPPMLRLHVVGTAFAVLREWSFSSGAAEGWYVNLESPWRRTAIGFDSCDLVLDVVPAADLSSWSWKDRDELEWSVEQGKFSREAADEVVREGERVVARLRSGEFPFVDDWSSLRPDESWEVPSVLAGWDDPAL